MAGYFCHPLRGILSMRETLAEYDFRSWMDMDRSLAQKGRPAAPCFHVAPMSLHGLNPRTWWLPFGRTAHAEILAAPVAKSSAARGENWQRFDCSERTRNRLCSMEWKDWLFGVNSFTSQHFIDSRF